MGFSFNGLSGAAVTISGAISTTQNLPTPNASQTVKHVGGLAGTGAVQNGYTVTTGKTFYLYGFCLAATSTMQMNVFENDGTTYVAAVRAAANDTAQVTSSVPIAVYTSTQVVKVQCGGAAGTMSFWGVEQ